MRSLCLVLFVLILAGCSQKSTDVAPSPSTDDASITGPHLPPETSSAPTQNSAAPPEPAPPEPAPPEPAPPEPAPPEPANTKVGSPEEEKLSPAELIARKLISHNSDDNLEVLNEALERWLTKKDALPERIGDLVNEQFLPMLPMAPEGKIFAIDAENRRVILIAEEKK